MLYRFLFDWCVVSLGLVGVPFCVLYRIGSFCVLSFHIDMFWCMCLII